MGFPDVSLLEPLADALGLSVISLLHGERMDADGVSDQQVRDALRIVSEEVKKKFRKLLRVVKLCMAGVLGVVLLWRRSGSVIAPLFR